MNSMDVYEARVMQAGYNCCGNDVTEGIGFYE